MQLIELKNEHFLGVTTYQWDDAHRRRSKKYFIFKRPTIISAL